MTDERIAHLSPFTNWHATQDVSLWGLALRQDQRPEGPGRAACGMGTALGVERDRGRQGHLFQAAKERLRDFA